MSILALKVIGEVHDWKASNKRFSTASIFSLSLDKSKNQLPAINRINSLFIAYILFRKSSN